MGESSFVIAFELFSDAFNEYLQEIVIASVLAPLIFAEGLPLGLSFLFDLSHKLGNIRFLLHALGSFGFVQIWVIVCVLFTRWHTIERLSLSISWVVAGPVGLILLLQHVHGSLQD